MKAAVSKVVGEENVLDVREKAMIGEDFAFFLKLRPGSFFLVGACPDDCWENGKTTVPHHSPQFDFDEKALEIGVLSWLELVRHRLLDG